VDFSIVIPTYNRVRELAITLTGLGCQRAPGIEYEVIIVDDGSDDGTAEEVRRFQQSYPVHLHYLYQENRKQGAARNLGVRNASGDYLLFLGDDIEPTREFLAEHLRKHRQFHPHDPSTSRIAVLGYTTWPKHYRRTRFLEYVGEKGWQFGYSIIGDPDDVPFNFFYTSNISLSRRFFIEVGGFDEDFHEYGWEDIELSNRLMRAGMRLVYNSSAVAFHHHPTSIASFVERQKKVGLSALPFLEKHPDLREFLGIDSSPEYGLSDCLKMALLKWACRLTENRRWPDLSRFYPDLMTYYYLRGVAEGKKRLILSADIRS